MTTKNCIQNYFNLPLKRVIYYVILYRNIQRRIYGKEAIRKKFLLSDGFNYIKEVVSFMTGLRVVTAFSDAKIAKNIGEKLKCLGCNITGSASDEAGAIRLITTTEPGFVIMEGSRLFLEAAKTIGENWLAPLLLVMNRRSWEEIGCEVEKWDFDCLDEHFIYGNLKIALKVCVEKFQKNQNWAKEAELIRSVNTTRNVVEKAKIILMKTGLSELQALHKIQIKSQIRGIPLRCMANEIIKYESGTGNYNHA